MDGISTIPSDSSTKTGQRQSWAKAQLRGKGEHEDVCRWESKY